MVIGYWLVVIGWWLLVGGYLLSGLDARINNHKLTIKN
jgi:hypothetical protein